MWILISFSDESATNGCNIHLRLQMLVNNESNQTFSNLGDGELEIQPINQTYSKHSGDYNFRRKFSGELLVELLNILLSEKSAI